MQNILTRAEKEIENEPGDKESAYLRHTAIMTLMKRERRPKVMIFPMGSGWKTVPRRRLLS